VFQDQVQMHTHLSMKKANSLCTILFGMTIKSTFCIYNSFGYLFVSF